QRPQFVPTSNVDGVFVEQFTDDWLDRWVLSKAQAPPEDPTERRALVNKYKGKWAVEPAWSLPGLLGDKGLVVKSAKRFSAISAPFKETLDNTGKTLVVQYEVKLQNGLDCGGAYLKLVSQPDNLESPADLALDQFSDKTPYTIMFGPDKCVHNKIHFIFRHKNPRTGEFEEKHLKVSPMAILTRLSNLYTLIVRPDNSFEILINMEQVANGTLHDSFEPSVNPPKEIDDPKDKKPLDWVDAAKIPDPTAVKPADWDETAPYEIPDTDAKMPEDWLENEPEEVDDPAAAKPADWDDEEDGDWTAPKVANPKCKDVSGCGKWTPPTKLNPEYKGKWVAPLIANPAYVGPWSPRKIPNPDYFEDKHPSHFTKIGAVGFELWTIQDQIMFDNLYIGHSEEAARQFAKDSWAMKYAVELEAEKE
ncbi:Calreticulin/calnexin, partial [Ramicandelaber brevisporus]